MKTKIKNRIRLGTNGQELNKAVEAVRMTVEGLEAKTPNLVLDGGKWDSRVIVERKKIDWEDVDWSSQDVVISREVGCSRERVRQKRKELGLGKSLLWHKRQESLKEDMRGMETEGRTLRDLAKELGCKPSYVMHCLKDLGKGYLKIDRRLPLKYRWDLANWERTDAEVAKDLGVDNVGVVSQYRFRHGIWKRADKVAEAAEAKERVTSGVERV